MNQQFFTNPKNSIWLVIFIQTILILWVFQPFFLNGENILFCPFHDGLKNYYTYYTYLLQDKTVDFDFYNWMNYPYGEYIFYTDQTPSLSVPLKWFSDNIYDLKPFAFRIFNWFCISGILLSSIFSWLILKEITKRYWLWSIFAITLPWMTSQVFRLGYGHFNLCFSWGFLAVFYLLIKFYQKRKSPKKRIQISISIIILTYFISFIHLYYLPMLCLMTGFFGLLIGIKERKNWKKSLLFFSTTTVTSVLSLLSVFFTLRHYDQFYTLRNKIEKSYTWWEWYLKPDALWTSYESSTIPSILSSDMSFNFETELYLGAFSIYGFLILTIWLIAKTIQNRSSFKPRFKTYFAEEKGSIILMIFFTGLMFLNIAIGEYVKVFNNVLSFDNPLHPFKYLKLFIGEVTQFRVLARFGWLSFWAFNFLMIYLFDQVFDKHKSIWIRGFIILLMLTSVLDMLDNQQRVMTAKSENVLLNQDIIQSINMLTENIETNKYQAILPLPFYSVGSEIDSFSLMPNDTWRTETFVLSLETGLPLLASNLSRSAVIQHQNLLSIFSKEGMNERLKAQFDERSILVFVAKEEKFWEGNLLSDQAQKRMIYGKNIIDQYEMKLVKSTPKHYLYEWKVK